MYECVVFLYIFIIDMLFFSVWDIKIDKKELIINYEYGVI